MRQTNVSLIPQSGPVELRGHFDSINLILRGTKPRKMTDNDMRARYNWLRRHGRQEEAVEFYEQYMADQNVSMN